MSTGLMCEWYKRISINLDNEGKQKYSLANKLNMYY